jgi:hypothetical protein
LGLFAPLCYHFLPLDVVKGRDIVERLRYMREEAELRLQREPLAQEDQAALDAERT